MPEADKESGQTVKKLKDRFPEPTKLISDLFKPLVEMDKGRAPYLKCRQMLNGRIWKASLQFNFPQCFHVAGVHQDKETAKEYAHLVACDMFMHLGIINAQNSSVFTPEKILEILTNMASKCVLINNFLEAQKLKTVEMSSNYVFCDSAPKWTTKISVNWPVKFSVEGKGLSVESSQHEAALLAAHKMKFSGLFDKQNEMQEYVLKPKRIALDYFVPDIADFNPDCIVYVDASRKGFGAYLQIKGETGVRWLTERWQDNIKSKYFMPHYFSTLGELYALVTAIYTWKHKFVNKRVLCYSDCRTTVCLVNRSLYIPKNTPFKFYKLCNAVSSTSQKYNFQFLACHVNRGLNKPADQLSRHQVEQFKKEVPEAYTKSKKIKKLLFLEPLLTKTKQPDIETKK